MESPLGPRFALASLKARMFGRPERVELGGYEIRELIGRGGMGDVYLAHDPRLGRDVALKLLGRNTADDPREQARLLKEARTLARLKHPNVITVHDVGADGSEIYLAMEYVEGGDLDAWLAEAPRSTNEIVRVLLDAGKGLAAAHRAGIVHRDFKPSNVLIDRDGQVRVVDFGVASLRGGVSNPADASGPLTHHAVTTIGAAGTPVYMAPEQHEGGPVDARADQFAWCATLYEALAGTVPFDAPSLAALLEAKRTQQLGPPRRRVPPRIMRVLRRGLRPDPNDRFGSMEAPMHAVARAATPRWRTPEVRVATVAALGALAWWAWPSGGRTSACPSEHELVQAHWSEALRAPVEQALTEHAPQFGARAWSWIEPRVNTEVAHWSALQRRSCESLLHSPDAPHSDPRSVCLERWASTLDHVVETLAAGRFDSARDAIGIVEQIPDPEACGRQGVTGSSPLLSGVDTARERARIMQFLDGLDRGRVLRRESYLDEVVNELRPAVQRAAQNGWIAAQAEAATDLGSALMAQDRLDEAVESLRLGVASAVRSGHSYIEATARIALVQALGERQAQFELAELERVYAQAAVDRLGDPVMQAEYELVVGGVAWRHGDAAEAATHIERALEIFAEQPGTGSLRHAIASAYLGSIVRRIEPARAEVALRGALTTYQKKLDDLHPLRINTMTDLAEAVSFQGRSQQALEIMREVVDLLERQEPARRRAASLVVARYRLANVLGNLGHMEEAVEHLRSALVVARGHFGDEHPTTLGVRVLLGTFATELATQHPDGDWLNTAEPHLVAASAGYDRSLGEAHPDSLLARFYLGRLRALQGQTAEARRLLEACVAYRSGHDQPSPAVDDIAIQARVTLAELIWTEDPARATTLAEQAWTRLDAVADPEARDARQSEVTAWLCEHELEAPDGTTLDCPAAPGPADGETTGPRPRSVPATARPPR